MPREELPMQRNSHGATIKSASQVLPRLGAILFLVGLAPALIDVVDRANNWRTEALVVRLRDAKMQIAFTQNDGLEVRKWMPISHLGLTLSATPGNRVDVYYRPRRNAPPHLTMPVSHWLLWLGAASSLVGLLILRHVFQRGTPDRVVASHKHSGRNPTPKVAVRVG
jgi:hypothetical protein